MKKETKDSLQIKYDKIEKQNVKLLTKINELEKEIERLTKIIKEFTWKWQVDRNRVEQLKQELKEQIREKNKIDGMASFKIKELKQELKELPKRIKDDIEKCHLIVERYDVGNECDYDVNEVEELFKKKYGVKK